MPDAVAKAFQANPRTVKAGSAHGRASHLSVVRTAGSQTRGGVINSFL